MYKDAVNAARNAWRTRIFQDAQFGAALKGKETIGKCLGACCACSGGVGHWTVSPDEGFDEERLTPPERKIATVYNGVGLAQSHRIQDQIDFEVGPERAREFMAAVMRLPMPITAEVSFGNNWKGA